MSEERVVISVEEARRRLSAELAPSNGHGAPDEQPEAAHVVRMSDVAPERVSWLWPGRIPFGKLTILDGDPKTGKSTAALDLAARVSTGSPFPDGHKLDGPRGVVLLTAEDGLGDTVRPRLDAAGADPTKVVVFESIPVRDDDGNVTLRPPSLPRDIAALERVVCDEAAVFVIIDVLAAYLGPDVDGHKDQDVRRALMPLARLAERTGAAVVCLRHLTKSRGGSALYAGGGSIGIVGAARAVLLVAVDPDDESRRVLAVTACNVAAPVPALGFQLVPAEENDCARVGWLGATEHQADDLVAVTDSEDRSALAEAVGFLYDLLADGSRLANDVTAEADQEGITKATLRRAKKKLKIVSDKEGTRQWYWSLPAGEGAQGAHLEPEKPHDSAKVLKGLIPTDLSTLNSLESSATDSLTCQVCGAPARPYLRGDWCELHVEGGAT